MCRVVHSSSDPGETSATETKVACSVSCSHCARAAAIHGHNDKETVCWTVHAVIVVSLGKRG